MLPTLSERLFSRMKVRNTLSDGKIVHQHEVLTVNNPETAETDHKLIEFPRTQSIQATSSRWLTP